MPIWFQTNLVSFSRSAQLSSPTCMLFSLHGFTPTATHEPRCKFQDCTVLLDGSSIFRCKNLIEPHLIIKFKDDAYFFLESNTISCSINLRLKVLKSPVLILNFTGHVSSHINNIRCDIRIIFTTTKLISIDNYIKGYQLGKLIGNRLLCTFPRTER